MNILIKIYEFLFKKYLYNEFSRDYDKIIKIKSWRTFLTETTVGCRKTVTPLFWWFK